MHNANRFWAPVVDARPKTALPWLAAAQ
jgi:hypothetical protein